MKNKILLSTILICFELLAGCTISKPTKPIYTRPAENNKGYEVTYLFEHDGCKVYKFMDMGNWVYFTSCQGETSVKVDSATTIRNTTNKRQ